MSLAETQRVWLLLYHRALSWMGLLLAPLHPNVNYRARSEKKKKKKRASAFHNGPSPFSSKQMAGRAWDFNHRNKARTSLSSGVPVIPARWSEMEQSATVIRIQKHAAALFIYFFMSFSFSAALCMKRKQAIQSAETSVTAGNMEL